MFTWLQVYSVYPKYTSPDDRLYNSDITNVSDIFQNVFI